MLDHEYGFAVLEGDFINLLMALSTNGHILGASVWDPAKSNGLSVRLQQHKVLTLPFWKWTLHRNTTSTGTFIIQTLPRLTLSGNSTDCKVSVTIGRRDHGTWTCLLTLQVRQQDTNTGRDADKDSKKYRLNTFTFLSFLIYKYVFSDLQEDFSSLRNWVEVNKRVKGELSFLNCAKSFKK